VKKFFSKRAIAVIFAIFLALFLIRPQVGHMHVKIADLLSWELGRPVDISSVHIRFLPRPGLELENFAIHDNAFGAEPILRSPDVTAWLRLSSLLRGRIEISSLTLSDASLNLCRDPEGKWNIEELVVRAARSSTAPTSSGRKEPRREFPYVEADHARINFKNGMEKTHFALTNAEFALWQESENEWGVRLRASPIRTDANLTDTGVISVEGKWQRSVVLQNTPVQFSWEWKQAQIGQVSRLLFGSDKEWRGDVHASGTVSGTLGKSLLKADASIDELRRQDVLTRGDLQVAAHCAAEYDATERTVANLDCSAPAGDGSVELKGRLSATAGVRYELMLVAKDVPAQSALGLVRQVKENIPADLRATGNVNLSLAIDRSAPAEPLRFSGEGEVLGTRLVSTSTGAELPLGTVPLRFISITPKTSGPKSSVRRAGVSGLPELQVGPVSAALGRTTPAQAQLVISRAGYKGLIRGEATLKQLMPTAKILRFPLPEMSADGTATFNLALSHNWGDTTSPVTGSAELRAVRAQVRGLNAPLQIHRADLRIDTDAVRVTNLQASAGQTNWRGTLQIPRPCAAPESCEFQFQLRAPEVTAASLNQLLNPATAKRPWYRRLGLGSAHSFFSRASASGTIAIGQLVLGRATCKEFSGDVELKEAKVTIKSIRGEIMDGRAAGTLNADFSKRPPVYAGNGTFEDIALTKIDNLMGTKWADGNALTRYHFTSAGWSVRDVLEAAQLNASFDIKDGVFPHITLAEDADPLQAKSFSGELAMQKGQLSFKRARLDSESGAYDVSGTATLEGTLNLKMTGEDLSGYNISGTLAETHVSPFPAPPTQAALKP
jgi:uncharacterized protein involved in outer membrane biogenesis